jgi:hypothetical protein
MRSPDRPAAFHGRNRNRNRNRARNRSRKRSIFSLITNEPASGNP